MNNHNNKFEDFSRSEIEASDWLAKIDRGLTAEEQDRFTEWLGESEANKEAMAIHSWGWSEFDRLAGLTNIKSDFIDEDLLDPKVRSYWAEKPNKLWFLPNTWQKTTAIAAAIVVGVTSLMFFQSSRDVQTIEPFDSSKLPTVQKRILPDGSYVELNIDSSIEVTYTEQQRLVRLLKGEGLFDVNEDPLRPFVVEASGVNVRAVGTIFNVRLSEEQVNVIVTEGTVALSDESVEDATFDVDDSATLITESQKAVIHTEPGSMQIEVIEMGETQISDELIWRPAFLEFDDISIREIVHEFNRRNATKILLADSSLDDLKLSTVFWSDNAEGFVRLLESEFDITAYMTGDGKILLSKDQ